MHERQKKAKPMTLHSYHNDAFFPDHLFSCFRQCSRDSYRQLVQLQIPGTGADGQINNNNNNNKLHFWSEILHQLRPGEFTLIHKTWDICRVKPDFQTISTKFRWAEFYEAFLYKKCQLTSGVVHCMKNHISTGPGLWVFPIGKRWFVGKLAYGSFLQGYSTGIFHEIY